VIDAQSIMNTPLSIEKNSTINDAIRILEEKKISRLVVSGEKSIITEKDIGLFLLNDSSERTLNEIPISEVKKPLISVDKTTRIKDCAKAMIENAIGSLGISENDSTIGIITKTDLVRYFSDNYTGRKTVGEYATWYYAWVYSDTPLFKVVPKMIDERVSRIILRNHNENPEGILTFRDLFRVALQGNLQEVIDNKDPAISVIFTRKGFLSESGFGGTTTAHDIMTNKIVSVYYDDDLADVCKVLLENNINAVGVLSSQETIIGILSKTDVIRAIAFLD
jgi:CBS domain-containing protein